MNEKERLNQILAEVQTVKAEVAKGTPIATIAAEQNLSVQYVTDIMITIQGSPEDGDLAVAMLLMDE